MPGWSMDEDELDLPALRKAAKDQVRVVLPMSAWDELEYLVDDSTEEETDLPSRVLGAWKASHGRFPKVKDNVSCEGEEEGESWAFYVAGYTVEDLLPVVRQAIPDGWTANVVAVPPDAFAGGQIAVTRV